MFYLDKKSQEYGDITVGILGQGIMGKSLLTNLKALEGFGKVVVSSRRIESVVEGFQTAGYSKEEYIITDDLEEAKKYFKEGKNIGTINSEIAAIIPDVVVDCTGDTEAGTRLSLCAIENKTHIVSLNVEMDATVGVYLKYLADKNNIVYSGSYGDEPGAIVEIYEFCKESGYEVLVLGKGKNNKLNNYITRDDVREDAINRGISPRMLTSFVDGTNTMIELNSVCNALGFVPDVRGCHFFNTNYENLTKDIKLKKDGGVLNKYGIVDFAKGIAPGVFAIVTTKDKYLQSVMSYLSMGDGDTFPIYRPYHLTSFETPRSIKKAVLLNEASIAPEKGLVADTVAVAKRDIKKGEEIESIGGDMVFGVLEDYREAKLENHLPIGIITDKTYSARDISKGSILTYEDVLLNEGMEVVRIRLLQNDMN